MKLVKTTLALGCLIGLVAACSGRGLGPGTDGQVSNDGTVLLDGAVRPDGTVLPDGAVRPDGSVPTDGTVPTDGAVPTDGTVPTDGAVPSCGNDVIDPGEECEGFDLGGATCETLGFPGGALACNALCHWDTAGCQGACQAVGPDLGCGDALTGSTSTGPDVTDVIDAWTGAGCSNWPMTGPERVFPLPPAATDQTWQIDLAGLTADLDVIVLRAEAATCRADLPCVAWGGESGTTSESVTFLAEAGVSYLVVVDGFSEAAGAYTLSVQCVSPEICDDGQDNDGDGDVDCADADCFGQPGCGAVRQVFEVFPYGDPNDAWDLDGVSVTFVPSATAPDGFTYTATAGVNSYPVTPGSSPGHTDLAFGAMNDTIEITLPNGRSFPFYGATYTSFWVNSHANLTFGTGDLGNQESAAALTSGLPRIAAAWDRYDVTQAGTVTVDRLADRIVVTWDGIPDMDTQTPNQIQAELWWTGQIRLTTLAKGGTDALVGVSEGGGTTGSPEVDLYAGGGPVPDAMGFHELFSGAPNNQIDLAGYTVTFTPDSQAAQGYTWARSGPNAALPFTAGAGNLSTQTAANLPDDGAYTVALTAPYALPFFGVDYGTVHVNSNGNLTFASADSSFTADAANHYERPRISGFFADLAPQNGGTVQVDEWLSAGGYTFVATYTGVPVFNQPNATATFQIAVRDSGVISLSWQVAPTSSSVVGIASGAGGTVPAETNFRP